MKNLVLLVASGCYACPTTPPPVVSDLVDPVFVEPGEVAVVADLSLASVGTANPGDPTWVCACECDAVWVTLAPSEPDTLTAELTPYQVDDAADLIVSIDTTATGSARCVATLASRVAVAVDVEVSP